MNLSLVDFIAFGAFLAVVVGVSLYAGRREGSTEDYFLAGRSLTWWLIGSRSSPRTSRPNTSWEWPARPMVGSASWMARPCEAATSVEAP